ncbi:MAG: hypothetical protein MJZ06_06315 [Bacteroidaceae bacterium]|nr:hypothetical protein [Bacteroidaceae bacterium]
MKTRIINLKKLTVCASVIVLGGLSVFAQVSFVPGYKGSAGLGYFWSGGGDDSYSYAANAVQFETSHGYEFTPHFYLGAGFGIHMFQEHESRFATRDATTEIPFFANTRLTVGNGNLKWYADLRAGLYLTEECSKYLSGTIGCRIPKDYGRALTVSFGMENAGMTFQELKHTSIAGKIYATGSNTLQDLLGFSFKIGYEF